MKKFVFIYHNNGDLGDMPMDKVTAAWMDWFGSLGDTLVDGGNPFGDGGQAVTKDGPMALGDQAATGYSIIQADSLGEAVKIAKGCPLIAHTPKGAVEVHEALPM